MVLRLPKLYWVLRKARFGTGFPSQTGAKALFLFFADLGVTQFFPGRVFVCQIFVATPKIGHALSGTGKNWARAEQQNRIRLGVPLL